MNRFADCPIWSKNGSHFRSARYYFYIWKLNKPKVQYVRYETAVV